MKQYHPFHMFLIATLLLGLTLAAAPQALAQGPATVYVDDDWIGTPVGDDPDGDGPATAFGTDAFATIQDAINGVAAGGTVNVAAGTYSQALNIESRAGLTIDGADPATVLVQPASTVCWDVASYGCGRTAAVRVVNSTDITFQDVTFDFALITGNNVTGLLMWDSTGVVSNNVLENMSLPDTAAYYEITAYVRAPGYTPAARAQVSFLGNTFVDTGRLGLVTHDYVHAIVDGNTFYKTVDDFGYAMEIGSQSTAEITGNVIYGYDTPAASDGSNSAAIYIENANTSGTVGLVKPVLIENNEIYDCQYAIYVGNEFTGYAGDVDIQVTATNNNLHDNVDGAVVVTDEGKSVGSSVSFAGSGNTLANNGDVGYWVYTGGDGDVTVSLSDETITGHDVGLYLNDYVDTPPTGSSYAVTIHNSTISGNTSAGVQIDYDGAVVDAEANWWGDALGPTHATNPGGTGDAVSDYVDYGPWLAAVPGTSPMTWYTNDSIQAAVDAASPGDTVNVAAGTYVEQVEIAKALTLSGAGAATIIESPDDLAKCFTTSVDNCPIVYVHDANDVVIQDLVVDGAGKGNLNYRFVGIGYRNAGGTVQRVAIDDIRDTPFSGAQHGVALYLYNDDLVSRAINVYDSTMAGFQKNGMALNAGDTTPLVVDVRRNVVTGAGVTDVTAQNGIQVWADLGSGTVADNVIDGIAYDGSGWVASSILNYYADLDITGNTITGAHMGIYNIDGAGLIAGNDLSIVKAGGFAYGIVATDPPHAVPAPFVQDDGEPHAAITGQTIQATLEVEISNNTVVLDGADSSSTYGIEADAGYSANDLALDIDGNTVANFEVGIEIYKCQSDCDTGVFLSVSANDNNLGGNGYGIRSNDTTITVDGRYNWWGSPSGPYHPTLNPTGGGSWVSDNVNFEPYSLPTWQKYAGNPVVTGSMALDPCVIKDGATYKMWYTHVDNSGNWTIYYATSADGIAWENQQQVLAPAGTWEAARVLGPSVILDGTTYRMWYTGRDAGGVYSIGYADSADGITWANRQQVITATAGAWDSAMVREPWVILDGGTYKMWYEGTDLWPNFAIGYAESTDGTSWTKHAGNPVLAGTPDGWDGFQVYAPSVVLDNGTYHMYFSGTDANMSQRWSTGYATSSDGLVWTEAVRNPILIPEGDDSLDYVSAMNDDGVWKIWYSYGGTYAIGLATMEFGTELYIDPPVASIPNDNTTTQVYTVQMVNAVDVYGYQFVFTFDPAHVEATAAAFDNSFFDTSMGAPPTWNATIDNVNGRVSFARTRINPQEGVSGSGPLATVTLRGKAGATADQYRLDFDLELISDVDANALDLTTQHGWLTLFGAGTLEGTVDLQGRPNESGAVVTIMTAAGYLASQTITDPAGAWSFTGVPAGSYQVNIEMARYLDGQQGAAGSGVAVPAGGTTTLNQLRMLGGDADDSDTVDISDAVIIGSMYGLTAPADARADINNDGIVDVLDLVLMGGNFTKTSPTTWL